MEQRTAVFHTESEELSLGRLEDGKAEIRKRERDIHFGEGR
jgi:hypothetical protein